MDQIKSPRPNKSSRSSAKSPPTSPTPGPIPTAPSPTPQTIAERRLKPRDKPTNLEPVLENDTKVLRRPQEAHHDDGDKSVRVQSSKELARRRSQYFHEALHERNANPAADFVRGEAMIMTEVKTNVKITNEYQFIMNLSEHLAARYNRKIDSIIVVLEHSRCLLFSGSAQPAYILTISALPSEVQTATNKRNTVILQRCMEAMLHVPSARGLVRFIPINEECLGWGGKTVTSRITELAGRATPDPNDGQAQERRLLKSLSLRRSAPTNVTPPSTQPPTPSQNGVQRDEKSASTPTSVEMVNGIQDMKVVQKKKSIIHTLFRSSRYNSEAPS